MMVILGGIARNEPVDLLSQKAVGWHCVPSFVTDRRVAREYVARDRDQNHDSIFFFPMIYMT